MGTFRLHIKSLENNPNIDQSSLPIWGVIYVESNGYSFPDEDWYDAVSSILDMWLATVINFMCSKNSLCELYFMDGPYRLRLNRVSTSEVNVSMLKNDKEVATSTCSIHDFLESIISSLELFCKLCRDNNSSFTLSKTFLRIEANGKKLKSVAANH